jgi:hypothetical protein
MEISWLPVYLYKCPACDCLPFRYRRKPAIAPTCVRCSRKLEKVSKLPTGYQWALGLAGLGLSLLTLPDLVELWPTEVSNRFRTSDLRGSLTPADGAIRELVTLNANDLMVQLESADRQWEPREEILADGSTRYLYKRRLDERDLSVAELRQLVESPPTFEQERKDILQLLGALKKAGVKVFLEPPLKKGAAGEWDHRMGKLRIQPKLIQKGSVDFLRVLNHEAIHVAQSCRGGSLNARPVALGLHVANNNDSINDKLKDPIYADTTQWEKKLEKEAYSSQMNSAKVKNMLQAECKLSMNMAN